MRRVRRLKKLMGEIALHWFRLDNIGFYFVFFYICIYIRIIIIIIIIFFLKSKSQLKLNQFCISLCRFGRVSASLSVWLICGISQAAFVTVRRLNSSYVNMYVRVLQCVCVYMSVCKCATQCADIVLNADKTEQSDVNGTGSGTGFATLQVIVVVSLWEDLEVFLSWPSSIV